MNERVTVDVRRYLPHVVIYVVAAAAFLLVKGLLPDFSFSFVIKAVPALSLAVAFFAAQRSGWAYSGSGSSCSGGSDVDLDGEYSISKPNWWYAESAARWSRSGAFATRKRRLSRS